MKISIIDSSRNKPYKLKVIPLDFDPNSKIDFDDDLKLKFESVEDEEEIALFLKELHRFPLVCQLAYEDKKSREDFETNFKFYHDALQKTPKVS